LAHILPLAGIVRRGQHLGGELAQMFTTRP